jgi:hypothetical protein
MRRTITADGGCMFGNDEQFDNPHDDDEEMMEMGRLEGMG